MIKESAAERNVLWAALCSSGGPASKAYCPIVMLLATALFLGGAAKPGDFYQKYRSRST